MSRPPSSNHNPPTSSAIYANPQYLMVDNGMMMDQNPAGQADPFNDPYSPAGQFGGMGMGASEPTTYLRDLLQSNDLRKQLFHALRGDHEAYDPKTQQMRWVPNKIPTGQPGGPVASDTGINIICSKLIGFLSSNITHGNFSDTEIHGYTFEAAKEALHFCILEAKNYNVQRWAFDQIILLVDSLVFGNLSRTLDGGEADRISRMYQAREGNPSMYSGEGGGWMDKLTPWRKR